MRKLFFFPEIPVVQLSPVHPEAHIHDPSVCLHVPGLQLGEHS